MSVCQTCGSRGYPETLVECSKCQIIAEHTYCLDKLVETDDGEVQWACEFCEPRIIELSDSDTDTNHTNDSFKIQDGAEDLGLLPSEEEQRVRDADVGPSTNELQSFSREVEETPLHQEEYETTRVETSNCGSTETSSSIFEDNCYSTIEPLPDPIWRGGFDIYGEHSCTIQGMLAHLSNDACKEASKVASSLPDLLRLEMVPKNNIWPMKFKKQVPTDDNIAVYFFPEDYRAEKEYDCLVDDIIEHDLAMISRVNNVELLIFSSCELPPDNWRLKRKYYLWGLFRRKKKSLPQNQSDECTSSRHGSINHTWPSNISTETGAKITESNTENFACSSLKSASDSIYADSTND